MRPGRLDRRIEFSLPDNEGRAHILRIHARSMSVERDIRFDLIARLCPNTTGAELRSVATEVCRVTSESLALSHRIVIRRACLPYARGARSPLNVTSLTLSRRLSDKARSSLARKWSPVPRNLMINIRCHTGHFTKCIIRLSAYVMGYDLFRRLIG